MVVDTDNAAAASEVLAAALAKGGLVEVYSDGNDDTFCAGRVDALTDVHVRLRAVDTAGRPNGVEIRALSTVSRVRTGSDYLRRRLEPLTALWPACGWPPQRLTGDCFDLAMDALTLSMQDRSVVTLWMFDTAQYTGPVVKLADDAGSIADLDEYGDLDREVPFRVAGIAGLDFGTQHERIVQHLSSATGGWP